MKRKTVLIIWIIGFVVALIGAALFVPSIVAAANHCTTNQFGGRDCSLPANDALTLVGLIGVGVLILGGLVSVIAWLIALIRSASMQTWGWFAVVLIFSGLGTLIYVLAGPADQAAAVGAGAPYVPPR